MLRTPEQELSGGQASIQAIQSEWLAGVGDGVPLKICLRGDRQSDLDQ
jgi:hypothetical protein